MYKTTVSNYTELCNLESTNAGGTVMTEAENHQQFTGKEYQRRNK